MCTESCDKFCTRFCFAVSTCASCNRYIFYGSPHKYGVTMSKLFPSIIWQSSRRNLFWFLEAIRTLVLDWLLFCSFYDLFFSGCCAVIFRKKWVIVPFFVLADLYFTRLRTPALNQNFLRFWMANQYDWTRNMTPFSGNAGYEVERSRKLADACSVMPAFYDGLGSSASCNCSPNRYHHNVAWEKMPPIACGTWNTFDIPVRKKVKSSKIAMRCSCESTLQRPHDLSTNSKGLGVFHIHRTG